MAKINVAAGRSVEASSLLGLLRLPLHCDCARDQLWLLFLVFVPQLCVEFYMFACSFVLQVVKSTQVCGHLRLASHVSSRESA